jgi:sugar/nucleoside kinase (ribokinase family)
MPNEISISHIKTTKYLHIDGRETEATIAAIVMAKDAGVKVILDAGSPRKELTKILSLVDYPVVSESFCKTYLSTSSYEKGLEKLMNFGATAAVITCGAKGCYGADENGVIYQPPFNVEIIDTTGAGDVFHGAFIYSLLQNWSLEKNLEFSSAAAAINCTHLGGRAGIPGIKKINQFLEERK